MVFCSDERMYQVKDNLAKDFCVYGIENMEDLAVYGRGVDVLVLPVKGVDASGNVACFEIESSFWETLDEHVIICSGMKTAFLEGLPQTKYYYMEDEDVIHNNAILTAEGVLNELIGCCKRSIYDVQVDVIGYGHCGKVIYEMLRNLQVCVRVIRRACEEDETFITIDHWDTCGDIIINTSIQSVLDEKRMCQWNRRPVIIDIATPDVIDIECAKRLGINVMKAGNLPGRFASISAGNIIAEYVRGIITHEG